MFEARGSFRFLSVNFTGRVTEVERKPGATNDGCNRK